MYLDFHVLIDSSLKPEEYDVLLKLHEEGLDEKYNKFTLLKDIKHLLNGIGRIIQFFNPFPNPDFTIPEHHYLWSVFEG